MKTYLIKKLLYKSRRGLLELDIILLNFVKNEINYLSDKELNIFDKILDMNDYDLLNQINGNTNLYHESSYAYLVEKIKLFSKKQSKNNLKYER